MSDFETLVKTLSSSQEGIGVEPLASELLKI